MLEMQIYLFIFHLAVLLSNHNIVKEHEWITKTAFYKEQMESRAWAYLCLQQEGFFFFRDLSHVWNLLLVTLLTNSNSYCDWHLNIIKLLV